MDRAALEGFLIGFVLSAFAVAIGIGLGTWLWFR